MKGLNMNEITLNKTEQLPKDGYKQKPNFAWDLTNPTD